MPKLQRSKNRSIARRGLEGFELKKATWLPYLGLTLTVLFWSGNFILGRGIRQLIPPVSLNFWRWTGALLILLPFGCARIIRQRDLYFRHWKLLALMSIPSIVIFNAFIYTALQTATAINTVLVNAMIPIFIALAAWLVFNDGLSLRQSLGVCTSFGGLLFIVTRGDLSLLGSLTLSTGDLWTMGASLSWAIYSILLRKRPRQMDPVAFLTLIVGFGLILSLPFYLWELKNQGGFSLTPASMGSLVYVALFPSVLSFIFWNHGVDKVGANRAGIFIHLMPVFSIILAILFLGERMRGFHIAGMLLIFGGIVLTTAKASNNQGREGIAHHD
jgi:drug/metabolite transporter (DMT)-like permease